MPQLEESSKNNNTNFAPNYGLDIAYIKSFLVRHKNTSIFIILFSIVISLIYAYTKKPTYESFFQIVLAGSSKNISPKSINSLDPRDVNVGDLNLDIFSSKRPDKKIETQIEILKSPLILFPAFDYWKNTKAKLSGPDKYKNSNFRPWRNKKLFVSLTKKTSVLNIAFQDEDKELTFDIVKIISESFQEYSKSDFERDLKNRLKYINEQIAIYKINGLNARSDLFEFSQKNNLLPFKGSYNSEEVFNDYRDVQKERLLKANELNELEREFLEFENAADKGDIEGYFYYLSNDEGFGNVETKLIKELDKLKLIIMEDSLKYVDQDRKLLYLREREKKIKNLLANEISSFLKKEINKRKAFLEITDRPKDVYLKYAELVRSLVRNEATLLNLEQQKLNASLEKARGNKPWELITEPEVNPRPVSPIKRLILAKGVIVGIFLSLLAGLFKDYKSRKLYSFEEIKSLLPYTILKKLQKSNKENWNNQINLIANKICGKEEGKIKIFTLGEVDSDLVNLIEESLNNYSRTKSVLQTKDLLNIDKNDFLLLVLEEDRIKRDEIYQIKEDLNLCQFKSCNWLYIFN